MPAPRDINTVSVKCGLVYLNDRVAPENAVTWKIPDGTTFVVTDIVVQNRGGGDVPVAPTEFTRFSLTSPLGTDVFFTVVGNETLNLHFQSGIPVVSNFRFYNLGNSSAEFVEFHITGRLQAGC